MSNLARLNPDWQSKKYCCNVIIETPKGRRNKFDYDDKRRLFKLAGLLPEGMSFPFDFGFIPSTLADDGDPLDVMVLLDEPADVGCLVEVRIIGVIEAVQIEKGKRTVNNRLLGVAIHSYSHEDVDNIDQLNTSLLDQVEQFFVAYNKGRGKTFKVKGQHGPKRAAELIVQGLALFKKQQ